MSFFNELLGCQIALFQGEIPVSCERELIAGIVASLSKIRLTFQGLQVTRRGSYSFKLLPESTKNIAFTLLLLSYPLVGVSGDYDSGLFDKNPAVVDLMPEPDSELTFYIPGFLPWTQAEFGVGGDTAEVER